MIQYHLEPSLSPLGELCLWIWPHSLHFCRATFLAFLATSILLVSCFFWWLEWQNSWVQHDRKQGEFHPLSIKSWQLGEAPWSFTHRASHTYNDAHLSLRRLVVTLWRKWISKKIKDNMKTTKENFVSSKGWKSDDIWQSGIWSNRNLTNWSSSKMYVRYGLICFFNLTVLLLRVNAPKAVLKRCC